MFESIDTDKLLRDSIAWLYENVITMDMAVELAMISIALLLGAVVRGRVSPRLNAAIDRMQMHYRTKGILRNLSRLVLQITAFLFLIVGNRLAILATSGALDTGFSRAVTALLGAWIVIQIAVEFISNTAVRKVFALTIWAIAALAIFGVLDETTAALNAVGMNIGDFRLSALSVIKGIIALFVLIYGALFFSSILERKVQTATSLTISSRVLIGKIIRVTLVVCALLIGITASGIDLSLFAVFGGAIGLGVGFGLQKGISNLFSGMLLLLDRSIKPGDVIELPGTDGDSAFGWVHHMGARYTEVITRDSKSFLIPNEDFITKQVVNWSHGDTLIRLEVKFGVSYESDPHIVTKLAIEAAGKPERVVEEPKPVCWLYEFGESSLNFKLRFWINDAEKGITNIRGQVMLALWDIFKENGIRIPYPHREVFIHQTMEQKKA